MRFNTHGLALAGRDLVPPFSVEVRLDPAQGLELSSNDVLNFQSVARVLPGRRLSGLVTLSGQTLFAKLFYGKQARRYWQRELQGAQWLQQSDSPSPRVVAQGATADEQGFVVLYEALRNVRALDAVDSEEFEQAVAALATLHDADLIQDDPHVDNFVFGMRDDDHTNLWLVDADSVRRSHILRNHFANLAQLLCQRTPRFDRHIERMWLKYCTVRGEYVAKMGSSGELRALTHRARQARVRRYLKKTRRECTEFVHHQSMQTEVFCDRAHWQGLQRFMVMPETYMAQGQVLKAGNSATVVRCTIGERRYVIKRYNIKGFWHRLRRWVKHRGLLAWRNGHWLSFLGIPTARPVALLVERSAWLPGVSYLIMPDEGEQDLDTLLSAEPARFAGVASAVADVLLQLDSAGLSHGDLKATNFLVGDGDQPTVTLIDYDAVTVGPMDADLQRFLRNWSAPLQAQWRTVLEAAGL